MLHLDLTKSIPSTFDHSIYIPTLYSGVLEPWYLHALLLTFLLVYHELRIICFLIWKFYLFGDLISVYK